MAGIDPNVQVALVSVFATSITTLGVIVVAMINNRKERVKSASAGVEAGVGIDERDILEQMLSLVAENQRKEETITDLRKKVKRLTETNTELRAQLRTGRRSDNER